jgi:WD40 repeat protein
VHSVAVTPDGTRAISGSADRTLRIWDLATRLGVGGPDPPHLGPGHQKVHRLPRGAYGRGA